MPAENSSTEKTIPQAQLEFLADERIKITLIVTEKDLEAGLLPADAAERLADEAIAEYVGEIAGIIKEPIRDAAQFAVGLGALSQLEAIGVPVDPVALNRLRGAGRR
jgi:hypothetical protein